MADSCLNAKYETTICSSVHETVAATCYAEKLRKEGLFANANCNFAKGAFVMVTDGDKMFLGSEGQLFEEFLQTRQLSGYVGEGQQIARVHQANYTSEQLAMVRFDQSFRCLPYDARRCKHFLKKSLLIAHLLMFISRCCIRRMGGRSCFHSCLCVSPHPLASRLHTQQVVCLLRSRRRTSLSW